MQVVKGQANYRSLLEHLQSGLGHWQMDLEAQQHCELWRGFFAGITLLNREALLLCVKVEAKEQSLEYGAMHYRAKVPPNPNPQPLASFGILCLPCVCNVTQGNHLHQPHMELEEQMLFQHKV